MHVTDIHTEADRQMTICNACRYCEGLCAVFPALTQKRTFSDGDLEYLANLCHSCGACFYACQYAPPHEFAVNVPKIFAELRSESYARSAWPQALAPLFHRNGLVVALATALALTLFLCGFALIHETEAFFAVHTGPGAFYRLMPHDTMIVLFGSIFLFALIAIAFSVRSFWRTSGDGLVSISDIIQAGQAAFTLRYLDGSRGGCMNEDEQPNDRRRLYHHWTFYGFLLCFASTSLATILHNVFGWQAPYPWYNPVVLLGVVGGIGLVIGPVGLLRAKQTRDPQVIGSGSRSMEVGFLVMLLLTSVSGLLLLVLRATPVMGVLLAFHLGVVFALFLTFPYGKFVHGFYRYAALVRFAQQHRRPHDQPGSTSSS